MDFEKICMIFTMQEPFYGILLSSMQRVPTEKVGTLGVGKSGNVLRLYYNPKFVAPLSVDTVCTLIKHEMLHAAFNHFTLWETRPDSVNEGELRNWAADLEVNGYLNIDKIAELHPVLAKDFGWPNKLGAMEYYRRLKQMMEQAQQLAQQRRQAQQTQKPCNGGQGGNSGQQQKQQQEQEQDEQEQQDNQQQTGTPQGGQAQSSGQEEQEKDKFFDNYNKIDEHDEWPTDEDTDMEGLRQMIDDLVDFAAAEVEKGRGELPDEMKGRIEKIRKKPKPVTDWKRYFRRYMGNEFTEFIRKSKKRESRRFPDAAGNRHRRKSHILVAIDTSGSVSMPEYKEFMGQIKTLTASADFHVVECDAVIQYEYDYKGKPNEILHGGGGTDFQPVIDLFIKERRKYDALVYFTDGYCPVPTNTPKDTLWVISSKGVKDRAPFRINGASCVLIPPQEQ